MRSWTKGAQKAAKPALNLTKSAQKVGAVAIGSAQKAASSAGAVAIESAQKATKTAQKAAAAGAEQLNTLIIKDDTAESCTSGSPRTILEDPVWAIRVEVSPDAPQVSLFPDDARIVHLETSENTFFVRQSSLEQVWLHFANDKEAHGCLNVKETFFKKSIGSKLTGWLRFGSEEDGTRKSTREQVVKLVDENRKVVDRVDVSVEMAKLGLDQEDDYHYIGNWEVHILSCKFNENPPGKTLSIRASVRNQVLTTKTGVWESDNEVVWSELLDFKTIESRCLEPLELSLLLDGNPLYSTGVSLVATNGARQTILLGKAAKRDLEIDTEHITAPPQIQVPRNSPSSIVINKLKLRNVEEGFYKSKNGVSVHLQPCSSSLIGSFGVIEPDEISCGKFRKSLGDGDFVLPDSYVWAFPSGNPGLEMLKLRVLGNLNSELVCNFPSFSRNTWLPLSTSTYRGEALIDWEVVDHHAPNNMLFIHIDQLEGLQHSRYLGPSEIFIEVELLTLVKNATVGDPLNTEWTGRTLSQKTPYFYNQVLCAPCTTTTTSYKFLHIRVKTIRQVILGSLTINISNLHNNTSVPLLCDIGKGSLSLTLSTNNQHPIIDDSPAKKFQVRIERARNLRIGKSELKVLVEDLSTSGTSNKIMTKRIPTGGVSNPKWNEVTTLPRASCSDCLLNIAVFTGSQCLGSTTIPRVLYDSCARWAPLVFKNKFAGEIEFQVDDKASYSSGGGREAGSDSVVYITIVQAFDLPSLNASTLDVAVRLQFKNQSHTTFYTRPDVVGIPFYWNHEIGPFNCKSTTMELHYSFLAEVLTSGQQELLYSGVVHLDMMNEKSKLVKVDEGGLELKIRLETPTQQKQRKHVMFQPVPSYTLVSVTLPSMALICVSRVLKYQSGKHSTLIKNDQDDGYFFARQVSEVDETDCLDELIVSYFDSESELQTSHVKLQQQDNEDHYLFLDSELFPPNSSFALELSIRPYPDIPAEDTLKVNVTRAKSDLFDSQLVYSVKVTAISDTLQRDSANTRLVVTSSNSVFWGEEFLFENRTKSDPTIAWEVVLSGYDSDSQRVYRLAKTFPVDIFTLGKQQRLSMDKSTEIQLCLIPGAQVYERNEREVKQHTNEEEGYDYNGVNLMDEYPRYSEAFQRFDHEGLGKIQINLVGQLVKEQLSFLIPNCDDNILRDEISQLDLNADGFVSLKEFLTWIHKKRAESAVISSSTSEASTQEVVKIILKKCIIGRSNVKVRVFVQIGNGEKQVTDTSEDGPVILWKNIPQVLQFETPRPRLSNQAVSISVVEIKTGKRIGWKNDLAIKDLLQLDEEVLPLESCPTRVRVEIIKAKGLRAADFTGILKRKTVSSDPYCVVKIGNKTLRTKVITKTLEPVWNEVLVFDLDPKKMELDDGSLVASVTVKDRDKLSFNDDFLGEVKGVLCCRNVIEEEYTLKGKLATGTILIRTKVEKCEAASLVLESSVFNNEGSSTTTGGLTLESVQLAMGQTKEMLDYALKYSEESRKLLDQTSALQKSMLLVENDYSTQRQEKTRSFVDEQAVFKIEKIVCALEERVIALDSITDQSIAVRRNETYGEASLVQHEIQTLMERFIREHVDHLYTQVFYAGEGNDPLMYDHLLQLSERAHRCKLRTQNSTNVKTFLGSGTLKTTQPPQDLMKTLVAVDEQNRLEKIKLIREATGIDFGKLEQCDRAELEDQSIYYLLHRFVNIPDLEGNPPTKEDMELISAQVKDIQSKVKLYKQLDSKNQGAINERKEELDQAIRATNDDLLIEFIGNTSVQNPKTKFLYARHIAAISKSDVHSTLMEMRNSQLESRAHFRHSGNAFRLNCKELLDRLEDCGAPRSDKLVEYIHKLQNVDKNQGMDLQPISDIDLNVLNMFGAVNENYLDPFQVVERFLFQGSTSRDVTVNKVYKSLTRRLICDERKRLLEAGLRARLEETPLHVRETGLFKRFVMSETSTSGGDLKEDARRAAAAIVKKEYLSYEKVRDELAGCVTVTVNEYQFGYESMSTSQFYTELSVVSRSDSAAVGRVGHDVAIARLQGKPLTISLESFKSCETQQLVLSISPKSLYLDGNSYKQILSLPLEEYVRKCGIPCTGWFPLRPEHVVKRNQGLVSLKLSQVENKSEAKSLCIVASITCNDLKRNNVKWVVTNGNNIKSKDEKPPIVYPGTDPLDREPNTGFVIHFQAFTDCAMVSSLSPVIKHSIQFTAQEEGPITIILGSGISISVHIVYTAKVTSESVVASQQRVEAVDKLSAVFRGHKTRKMGRSLGTVCGNISAKHLFNSIGGESESMTTKLRVSYHLQEEGEVMVLGTSQLCRRGGSNPVWENVVFDVPGRGTEDSLLTFLVIEDGVEEGEEVVASCSFKRREFMETIVGTEDKEWKSLVGGHRAKCASGVTVQVLKARWQDPEKLGNAKTVVSVGFGTHARPVGNKRKTQPKPVKNSMTVWNEAFRIKNGEFLSIHDSLTLTISRDQEQDQVLGMFTLPLRKSFLSTALKETMWLKSGSISLLVNCTVTGLFDSPAHQAALNFEHIKLKSQDDKPQSQQSQQPQQRPSSEEMDVWVNPGTFVVKILEASNISNGPLRPFVSLTLLSSSSSSASCTKKCWSDGKKAVWTKTEDNKLELLFPGCSLALAKREKAVKLLVEIIVEYNEPTVVGSTVIDMIEYLDMDDGRSEPTPKWYELKMKDSDVAGKIRLLVEFVPSLSCSGASPGCDKANVTVLVEPKISNTNCEDNEVENVEEEDSEELTVLKSLVSSVRSGDLEMFLSLLDSLDTDQVRSTTFGSSDRSLFHISVIQNRFKFVETLVDRNLVDYELKDLHGKVAADYCRNFKMMKLTGSLAKNSFIVNQKTQIDGIETLLHHIKPGRRPDAPSFAATPSPIAGMGTTTPGVKTGGTDSLDSGVPDTSGGDPTTTISTQESEIIEVVRELCAVDGSSPLKVFKLFDLDNDGYVDVDEVEGSLRIVLEIEDPVRDKRLAAIRSVAKNLCCRRRGSTVLSRSCDFKRFVSFFKLKASHARRSALERQEAKADEKRQLLKSCIEIELDKIMAKGEEQYTMESIWENAKVREVARYDINRVISCLVEIENEENAYFAQVMETFADVIQREQDCEGEEDDVVKKLFGRPMTRREFVDMFVQVVGIEHDNERRKNRFDDRVLERFGISRETSNRDEVLPFMDKRVQGVVNRKGEATQASIDIANEKLVQVVVDDWMKDVKEKAKIASQDKTLSQSSSSVFSSLFSSVSVRQQQQQQNQCDDDGSIDFFEFQSFLRVKCSVNDSSSIRQLFSLIDTNKNGRISEEEFSYYIEEHVNKKRSKLHSLLNQLRTKQLPTQHGSKNKTQRLQQRIARLKKKSEMLDNPFAVLKKSNRLSTFHEVDWTALVMDDTGRRDSTREVRIVSYQEFDETLILADGSSLLLGRDKIVSLYPASRHRLEKRSIKLLNRVQERLHSLFILEDDAARIITALLKTQKEKRIAQREVNRRKEDQRFREYQNISAVKIQSVFRGKKSRTYRKKLETLEKKKRYMRRKEREASVRIQSRARGYIVRNDLMEKRERSRVRAAVSLQRRVRGFLIRSVDERQTRREHESIVEAVRKQIRKGMKGRITVDCPRCSQSVIRFNLLLSGFLGAGESAVAATSGAESLPLPLYGLETCPSGVRNLDVGPMYGKVKELLKGYGISQIETQLGSKVFKNKRGESTFASIFQKTLEADDVKITSKMCKEIAEGVSRLYPVHDSKIIEEKIYGIVSSTEVAKRDGDTFKSFRYVQTSKTKSYAWIQLAALTSKRTRAKSLRYDMFTGTQHLTGKEDKVLEHARSLALVSHEVDLFSVCSAIMSDAIRVEKVEGNVAHLVSSFGETRYQFTSRLTFYKNKTSTNSTTEVMPGRPLCRKAILERIMCVFIVRGAVEDPRIHTIDFFDVKSNEDGTELKRAIWMPPVNSKIFAERVYASQNAVHHENQSQSVGKDFERVYWVGALDTDGDGDAERVTVDACKGTSTSSMLLRLTVKGGCLGWFTIKQCKNVLRLDLQVDKVSDVSFEKVSLMISPFDESGRILTSSLRMLRDKVATQGGGARRSFLKLTSDKVLGVTELAACLRNKFGLWSHMASEVDEESEVGFLFDRFISCFPAPLDVHNWEKFMEPPEMNILTWLSELLRTKRGGLVFLRAKFNTLTQSAPTGSLTRTEVIQVLLKYFTEEGLTEEVLHEIDWSLFEEAGVVNYRKLLACLENSKHTEDGEARHVKTASAGGEENVSGTEENVVGGDTSDDDEDDDGEEPTRDEVLDMLVDSDEEDVFGKEFMSDRVLRNALAELRYVILEYAGHDKSRRSFDVEKSFRVFDQDGTGLIDRSEFKEALKALNIEKILPNDEALDKFVSHIDRDNDGQLNYSEFVKMVGNHRVFPKKVLNSLKREHQVQTIRWEVEMFVGDLGIWVPGVSTKYRDFDHSVEIQLKGKKGISSQNIGFLQIDDYPIYLKRNLWSGKPWGRDPLWRMTLRTRKVENFKRVLKETYYAQKEAASIAEEEEEEVDEEEDNESSLYEEDSATFASSSIISDD